MKIAWPSTGAVKIGAHELEYKALGPSPHSAATIVLLHEGLGSVSLWRDFPEILAEETGAGVFVYSRAGYGQSSPADLPRPLDYMTWEAMEVLPEIFEALDLLNVVLVGHSDGATIAAIYAGLGRDPCVAGTVLMAPHFFAEPQGLAEISRAKEAFDNGDLRDRLAKHHRDPDNAFRGWNDAWLDPQFREWNVSNVLETIRVPVLAIQGKQDQYGTLAQIEEISFRCDAPVAKLILDDCRHAPFLDQQDIVLEEIVTFFERLQQIETYTV